MPTSVGAGEQRVPRTARFRPRPPPRRGAAPSAPFRHGRLSLDRHPGAAGAGDRGDDPHRQAFLQQDRTLLDMDLEYRGGPCAGRASAGTPAGSAPPRAIAAAGDALASRALEQARIEASRHRAAAEKGRREAHALLFRERDHVEVNGSSPAVADARRAIARGCRAGRRIFRRCGPCRSASRGSASAAGSSAA